MHHNSQTADRFLSRITVWSHNSETTSNLSMRSERFSVAATCVWTLLMVQLDISRGWSPSTTAGLQPRLQRSSALDASRRDFIDGVAVGVVGSTAAAWMVDPQVARADVTNKVASSPALRNLKRAQQNLPKLLPTVQSNDYVAVKAFLRTPPFDEVRKNGFILVRGGEDGPKAGELEASYKSFIASLEKIDGTASLGMRGRTIPSLQMTQEYDNIVAAMESFLKVAEESTEIPVQYSD